MDNGNQQTVCKTEEILLGQLEADIEEFDKIFLVMGRQKFLDGFLELIGDSEAVKERKQKVLVMASLRKRIKEEETFTYRQIKEYELMQLCRLYFLYEFSDRFQFISETAVLCGSLAQLVDTGLLSPRESVSALLY